jgi:TolB protein
MSRLTEARLDAALTELLDDLARGPRSDRPIAAALARTSRMRPRPAWLVPGDRALAIQQAWLGPAPKIALIGVLVLLILVAAIVVGGAGRRVPPPFGPARSGLIAYESAGHLWLAGPDGRSPRQITFGPLIDVAPVWSRDGMRLAYRRLTVNEPADDPGRFEDLLIADADGSHPITIATQVPFMSNPTWSPDNRFVAYTRAASAGPDHLIIASADGTSTVDRGDLGGGAWGPAWSPGGDRIAVGVGSKVVLVKPDGTGLDVVSHGSYAEVGEQGVVGDWRPDGTAFVFAAGSPDDGRVYLSTLDGTAEKALGVPDRNQTDATWSPDGTRIAYLRAGIGLGPSVVIADASGRDLTVLSGYYSWCTPVWSPDASRIIVYDDHPGPLNLEGPAVVLALDPNGRQPPIELAAPKGPITNDNNAGSWQRLAP